MEKEFQSSKYKIKLRYGGFFRLSKNSSTKRYLFGFQKSIYIDTFKPENKNSWIWFLESLKKAIGTPNGLVISSDMQKGLEIAITHVYPTAEHRECVRHLYSNFKKHFRGEFFSKSLWRAAGTYSLTEHEEFLSDIGEARKEALTYLDENHKKIWSRAKFGTTAKCDYITNNISEAFNSWIGEVRYPPAIKRPPGRPRKNRIKPNDETNKRQKCGRCGEYGHRQKTCKNAANEDD